MLLPPFAPSTPGNNTQKIIEIRKWISNRRELLEDIPERDRVSEINLEKNELPVTKTLEFSCQAVDATSLGSSFKLGRTAY
jgi:hypothetical protein